MKGNWTLFTILGVSLMLACESVEKRTHLSSEELDSPRDRTSPENVIHNIALSHRLQDIDLYKDQLSPRFRVRIPERLRGGTDYGGEMDYEADVASTSSLFETSQWIQCEMDYERPVPSTLEEFPESDGYWQILAHDVNFLIGTTFEGMDTLAVENDKCLYMLQREAATTPATWRVVFQQMF
jgi:hypothetical protein